MKLEVARGLFLVSALAVASLALVVWEQPGPKVLAAAMGSGNCPLPRAARVTDAKPDHDLLLFMFGMSQGLKPQS
ncbi:hypothetical protein [Pseudomonas sp. FEN]|uniref:hypothetical protein n=1 Tax=Pseudomonas sp. FEN TaxID=2767468 RepID=UPI00174DE54F|nr:hypothetical protein [Pseudomonas sp. FEN]